MKIGQVASEAGVSIDTVRFYQLSDRGSWQVPGDVEHAQILERP